MGLWSGASCGASNDVSCYCEDIEQLTKIRSGLLKWTVSWPWWVLWWVRLEKAAECLRRNTGNECVGSSNMIADSQDSFIHAETFKSGQTRTMNNTKG